MYFPLALLSVSITQTISGDGKDTNYLSMKPSQSKIEHGEGTEQRPILQYLVALLHYLAMTKRSLNFYVSGPIYSSTY